ncbi:unnamed protein product [Allacma fusca]|uniref:Glucosamine 6-phosphate N-acetyltransferase n=1 Tax=Allacma fusca TaxID=39272 RepID=A0A8J2KTD3_9HEXA|nr:unnamed protein product [Allacma fusca]
MSEPLRCSGAIRPEEENLYDRRILEEVKLEEWAKVVFDPTLSVDDPGEGLFIRPLRRSDYNKGFLQLLGQLTSVGDVTEDQFRETFKKMKSSPDTYFVTVIEDVNTGDVIGTTTLFIEQKFIRGCARRARIEDVVVNDKYRGKQLGKFLVIVLVLLAKSLGCYKISLDCRDTMIPFYESLGFSKEPQNGNFLKSQKKNA